MSRTISQLPHAHSTAIECPAGFSAAGVSCGIKLSGNDDLALILCPDGADAAAVFTRNIVCGAPIMLSREHLKKSAGRVRALVINSGCANAATGADGIDRATRVLNALSVHCDCPIEQVLMNSTGVIGVSLPYDRIITALPAMIESCSAGGLTDAARAIMTTDTRIKTASHTIQVKGKTVRVVGIAKGAGMIHPNMATMIAVVMTDAQIAPQPLDRMLRSAVDQSFHRISVDGDTSTNDAVYALASGAAGPVSEDLLAPALNTVTRDLAMQIVRDAEGASKFIHVIVEGADTRANALQVAQTVATSLLVRTSVAGGDPNWGRILAAAGRSGVNIDLDRIAVSVNHVPLFAHGKPSSASRQETSAAYACEEVTVRIDLGLGNESDEFMTSDLTEQYVRINAEYTS